jgi:choline kinase
MEILLSQHKNKLMDKITSVVLCAGEGTRAKIISNGIPKPLIKLESLNNQTILSLIISNLLNLNLGPIVVITGYLENQIIDYLIKLQVRNQYADKSIMIHSSGDDYKLGPLFSFLSFTKNSQIFKDDKIFMIIPGDTIFDYKLLKEISTLFLEYYSRKPIIPVVFYRQLRANFLKKEYEKYNITAEKSISYLKIKEDNSNKMVKEISQDNLYSFSNNELINQAIPIFLLTTSYVKIIKELGITERIHSIREVVNSMINKGQEFFAVSVSPDHNFYDIDTHIDLKILNEIKKGGQ